PRAADPDGRSAAPVWLRLHRDVVEREMLAVEADPVPAPERAADLEHLEEASDAGVPGHACGGELLADGRGIGGDADPEDHAALGDAVERADDLGEHHGVAQGGPQDGGAEGPPPG